MKIALGPRPVWLMESVWIPLSDGTRLAAWQTAVEGRAIMTATKRHIRSMLGFKSPALAAIILNGIENDSHDA